MIKNIPNILTVFRFVSSVAIFLCLLKETYYLFALAFFILASVTDYLDGYIARRFNFTSEIGEIIDPIADKVLIIFCLFGLTFYFSSPLIGFLSALIISREMWVSALRDYASRKNINDLLKVTFLAKCKTAIQMLTILAYLICISFNLNLLLLIADILLVISAIVTIYTGYEYTKKILVI